MSEASDFEYGTQLGFAKDYHKITPIEKSGHGLGLGELPKILWFHFNISTMAEARDFKIGTPLGLPRPTIKPHPEEKWEWP